MNQLLFGTAGIPLSTEPRNTIEGIKQVKKLGLDKRLWNVRKLTTLLS